MHVMNLTMSDIQRYLNEHFLVALKPTHNWFFVKNNLFKVDLNWLNSLDEDKKFNVVEVYFYTNIFYASYECEYRSKKYKLVIDVYIKPKLLGETYVGFEYELGFNLFKMEKKTKILESIEFLVKQIDDVVTIMNHIFLAASLDLEENIQNNTLQIAKKLESFVGQHQLGEVINDDDLSEICGN